jgi:hypothetical protein
VAPFKKKKVPKSPFYNVKSIVFCGTIGKMVVFHVSKAIKLILVGAQVETPNICTFIFFENLGKQ